MARHTSIVCGGSKLPQTVDDKRRAPGFIDKYITCCVPKEGEDDELRQLVL